MAIGRFDFDDLVAELDDLDESAAMVRLCTWSTTALPVCGTGVTLIIDNGHRGSLGSSNAVAATIEELQFRCGEGPCLDAHRTGAAVVEPDLLHSERWPGFGPDAVAGGIAAVFAFPLRVGSAGLGALDLYQDEAGVPSPRLLDEAQVVADIAAALVLGFQANAPGELSHLLEDLLQHRAAIHEATGMASVQMGVCMADALVAIRARAYTSGRSVGDVSSDIISRRLRLQL